MSKTIPKGKSTYFGFIKLEDGSLVCEKCQNKEAKFQSTMHLDGSKTYETHYRCECGNMVAVKTKRDKDDLMYWEDET